jgi:lipoprotein NlpI
LPPLLVKMARAWRCWLTFNDPTRSGILNMKYATVSALVLAASFLNLPVIADQAASVPLQMAQAGSELDFWNSIKDSKKAEDYQSYLDKYPNGNFADLAKLRVKKYPPAPAPALAPTPAPAAVDPQQADIAYWNSIKASKNADDYKAYLEKYPNGEFVDLANLRVEQLGAPAAVPAEPPAQPASAEPKTAEPTEPAAAEPATTQPATTQPASIEPPASPAPAQAPTFVAKNATVYAKNGGQVRAAPDPKAALVIKLKTNTEVHATGLSSDGRWWRVEVPGGQGGYMHHSVVSEQRGAAAPSSKKSSTEQLAAGPDEAVCPSTAQVAPNNRVAACERLVAKAGSDDQAKLAALGDLAASLTQARRYDEAIRKYEQAAALAPRDATIYYDIGLVRLDQLRFPEARAAFEKAAQLDPQNPDIVFQRGNSYIGVGDFETAKLEVKRALLSRDDAAYYEKLGEIEIARGDLDSAKTALDRGRKADAGRHSLILAAVNYYVGDNDTAAGDVSAVMDDPTAALWNALIKKTKGDAAGAAGALEAGRAAAGDTWPAPIFDVLSGTLSLAKARSAAKARDDNVEFQQLCALNFFAGEWAYLSGDKDAARTAFQAALATRAYYRLEFAAAKARLANMGG